MFGRRSHARYNLAPSSEGVLRVVRDVIVERTSNDELLAIGREAGIVGDVLTVEVAELEALARISVRVVDSRPVVVDGAVRHRLRLQRIPS